ncbi:MAG: threonine synthase [Pseudomonadota bacterium]
MRYYSTRSVDSEQINSDGVGLEQALTAGLAADGGLFVPAQLPRLDVQSLHTNQALSECASQILAPYFADSSLEAELERICHDALNLALPIIALHDDPNAWMLELFHGPTAAFKDFAARFLAACLGALRSENQPDQTVLVATSGDTGAAVAAAFHRKPGFSVVILYPDGKVAPRQAHQLGAFGDNVRCFRVQGNFDDCQRLAKQALNDATLVKQVGLTSANSISIGRLLPQISYYALAALRLGRPGQPLHVIVPTGNLGNALACVLAREMGLPIGRIVLATNANRTLPDFFQHREYRGRPGLATLANAMDVGDPSNFERLAWLYRERDLHQADVLAESVDDATIRACIARVFTESRAIICPHTACAVELLHRYRAAGERGRWLVAATAHPAKFNEVVEPIIGQTIPLPPALETLLKRPSQAVPLAADFDALTAALTKP